MEGRGEGVSAMGVSGRRTMKDDCRGVSGGWRIMTAAVAATPIT